MLIQARKHTDQDPRTSAPSPTSFRICDRIPHGTGVLWNRRRAKYEAAGTAIRWDRRDERRALRAAESAFLQRREPMVPCQDAETEVRTTCEGSARFKNEKRDGSMARGRKCVVFTARGVRPSLRGTDGSRPEAWGVGRRPLSDQSRPGSLMPRHGLSARAAPGCWGSVSHFNTRTQRLNTPLF